MQALGELEYYLFSEVDRIYPITNEGLPRVHPFSNGGVGRREAMSVISEMAELSITVHAEVGNRSA